jgi:UDP-glucose 4-epimerase
MYAKQFFALYGLETVALRYFNVYGPNMADEGAYVTVLSVFKRQALQGEPLTIEGDGEQTRDFTHVHDVVDANVRAMMNPNVGKGEVFNVGAGERHSVNKVAKLFNRPVEFLPPRPGDTPHTHADISLTREHLGWSPTVRFDEGVARLLKEWGL